MNLAESIKQVEQGNYTDLASLKEKLLKINEIIWSLRHGNFNSYSEAMEEIDELFTKEDYNYE